jgi:large subunit ribosomal protein L14e
MSLSVGRLCMKIAGRDAGLRCVVVDDLGDGFVLIDGETRRRKCNVLHLEPLGQVVELAKGASHAQVAEALKQVGIETRQTKPRKAAPKPARKLAAPKTPAVKPAAKKPAPAKAVKAAAKAPAKPAAAAA